jgi:hypothetical protein
MTRSGDTPATHTATEGPQPEVRDEKHRRDERRPDTARPETQAAGRGPHEPPPGGPSPADEDGE